MKVLPFVSCVMLTRDRRIFARQALRYFARSTYPESLRQLIIVDDGREPLFAATPALEGKYIRLEPGSSLGHARNVGVQEAEGEIIVTWDDDDWHAPGRIGVLVDLLDGADIVGSRIWYVYDITTRGARRHINPPADAHGGSIAYWKRTWTHAPYGDHVRGNEDRFFIKHHTDSGAKVAGLDVPDYWIYLRQPQIRAKSILGTGTLLSDQGSVLATRKLFADNGDLDWYDDLSQLLLKPKPGPMEGLPWAPKL